jgi:hypothetical protein
MGLTDFKIISPEKKQQRMYQNYYWTHIELANGSP